MSLNMKISLLALVSSVAAVPQYGHGHSKFHHSVKPSGDAKPYPTGGWAGSYNTTLVPQPTGTGAYGQDTTIDVTTTSTTTLYSTVLVKPSPVAGTGEAVVEKVTTGGASQCGPATVTVTASEKVTITVTPGGGAEAPKSSASPAVPAGESSAAPVVPSMGNGYGAPSSTAAAASSTAAPVIPSSKAPVAPAPSSEAPVAPAPSSEAPVAPAPSSKVESPSSAVVIPSKSAPYPIVTPPVQTPAASSVAGVSSAAPSAKPSTAPGSGNSYTGTKRGLAYNEASLCKTIGTKFGFGYNWAQTESNDIGTEFIPLIGSPQKGSSKEWLANVDKAVKKGSKAVMGFNECDHKEQCNLSPEAACTAWAEYLNPIAAAHPEVTIIGPSVTNGVKSDDGKPMGIPWLKQFQAVCPGAVMHATNIHFYSQADDETLTRFIKHIEDAHTLYGKPVWITEFGLNPGSAPEAAAEFLKGAMKYCDESPIVQGYSYFMVGNGDNYLSPGSPLSAIYGSA
jgi:hypothetical protein